MNQELSKNQAVKLALIVNLSMLMSAGMFLILTFVLPPGGMMNNGESLEMAQVVDSGSQTEARGDASREGTKDAVSFGISNVFFYMGLAISLAGLAIGHMGSAVELKKHILALALLESSALMGLLIQLTHGDTPRARSMIILGIVGIGSMLFNMKRFRQGPESN